MDFRLWFRSFRTLVPLLLLGGFIPAPIAGATTVVWEAIESSGFFYDTFTNSGLNAEEVDWGTLSSPQTITSFTVGYATDSTTDVGMTINFYEPHTEGAQDPLLASFSLTLPGLSGGGAQAGTFTHNIPVGQRFTINSSFEYGYQPTSAGNGTRFGPLLVNPNLVTGPGMEDRWDSYGPGGQSGGGAHNGTLFFGGTPYAQYYLSLSIPEPSTAALLLLGFASGLIRRRS